MRCTSFYRKHKRFNVTHSYIRSAFLRSGPTPNLSSSLALTKTIRKDMDMPDWLAVAGSIKARARTGRELSARVRGISAQLLGPTSLPQAQSHAIRELGLGGCQHTHAPHDSSHSRRHKERCAAHTGLAVAQATAINIGMRGRIAGCSRGRECVHLYTHSTRGR